MNWIKVAPETMPTENEPLLTTIRFYGIENPVVCADVRWNAENGWEWLASTHDCTWEPIDGEVTHWMPYPEPAED